MTEAADTPLQPRGMLRAGLVFDFGAGHIYTVPPLALGDVELLQDRIAGLADRPMASAESVSTVIDAAHRALSRNYLCTREQVAALVDVGNMPDVLEAVMDIAGVKRRAAQAAEAAQRAAPGNAQAPADPGTAGAASTPA